MKVLTYRLGLLVLIGLLIGTTVFLSNSEKPEKEGEELSKMARIDQAFELEFLKTRNPVNGEVPRENLMQIRSYVQNLANNPGLQAISPELSWEERGPDNVGGRTRAVLIDNANDPTNNTVFAGGVAGGLWKTTNFKDASPTWTPINDFFENIAVSAIVQDPNNADIMYFGTGEGWFNSDAVRGLGIWKSTNGGDTWSQLASTDNPDFYYVQDLAMDASSNLYASTREGGLKKSTNGGTSFDEVLSNAIGGTPTNRAADLEVGADGDIYVSMGIFSTGKVYKSDFQTNGANTGDAGTWTDITPAGDYWRIEMGVAPSDADVIYLTCQGFNTFDVTAIFRSDDQGASWTANLGVPTIIDQNTDPNQRPAYTRSQAWYDLITVVDPNNASVVYIGGVDALRSTDGAVSWQQITTWSLFAATGFGPAQNVHADHHMIVFEPGSSTNAIWATDGGIDYTTDANNTSALPSWVNKNNGYNVTQFYSGAISNEVGANRLLGGTQDNGTQYFTDPGVNSTRRVIGGDGGFAHIDQDNPQVQITAVTRSTYFITNDGWTSNANVDVVQIKNGGAGLFINPTDYNSASNELFCASFPGEYDIIQNVGTSNDIASRTIPGMADYQVTAVTTSPNVAGTVYMGGTFNVGGGRLNGAANVMRIDNASSATPTFTNITNNLPTVNGLYISSIEVENGDENHLLVTYSNYSQVSVFETTDNGATWTSVEGNLPDMPVRWAIFNPLNNQQALIATEMGVWSTNELDGANTVWGPTNSNLANVRVDMLQVSPADNQVLAATHGRGFFTSDDLQAAVVCDVEITSVDVSDPSVCGASDGIVTIIASGAANIEYSFDGGGSWGPSNTMNFAAGTIAAGQLQARDANDQDCSDSWDEPVTLTDPDAPTFQAIGVNPNSCANVEGMIIISGLDANTSFGVSLDNGGTFNNFTSDGSGTIEIGNLAAGTFNVVVEKDNCVSSAQSVTLVDEASSVVINNVDATNPSDCGAADGSVTIDASGATNIEYSFDGGSSWGPSNTMTFAAGTIAAGQLQARDADQTSCSDTWDAEVVLTDPNIPTFTLDKIDPNDCTGTAGSIIILGLDANTSYDVSIDNGGTFNAYTTDGSGSIVIGALTEGTYDVIVGQGNCVSSAQSITLTTQFEGDENTSLACNDQVNILLDDECFAELGPDAVLEGLACDESYYVKVAYPNDGHTIDEVVKCGVFKYVAYQVVGGPDYAYNGGDRAEATGDTDPDLEVCWGYVNAEDKTPPTACIKKVVGIRKSGENYDPFSNSDEDCADGILPRSAVADGGGFVDWKNPNYNLLICTDLEHIFDVPASWTDPTYPYYTGFPEGFDNCGDVTITWMNDDIQKYECEYGEAPEYVSGRLVSTIVKRTFRVEDDKGNEDFIDQYICFFKPVIQLPDCKEHLDACWYADVDPDNTEEELAPAVIESAPYYVNGICEKIYLDDHVCNVTATYKDIVLPGPIDCGFKVIRTWTILDWCWDGLLYDGIYLILGTEDCPQPTPSSWNNKSLTYEQHLIIGDDEAPIVECPQIDLDWDGDYDPIVYSVGPFGCESSFDVPAPKILNKDCGYNYTVEIYTEVPVLWHGVPTGETELVEFTGAQITDSIDPETGETIYVKAAGIPKGDHYFKYLVTDNCGNYGESEMCPFSVVDKIEPSVVCDDQLNVSVGSGSGADSGLGFARVYAEDVDEGSWDNCSPIWLQVRRFVPADIADLFVAGSDLALEGYPNNPITLTKEGVEANGQSGFYTYFADYVDFICADVGQKVVVELGAWDDADMNGEYEPGKDNFNTCWLETLVEDKINPICEAPHDITIRCDEVPFFATLPEDGTKWSELSESEQDNIKRWFGDLQTVHNTFPKAWDNCEADVAMVDVRFDLHCRAGKVTRIFQATDGFGRQSATCSQVITLTRYHDYCVIFPKDAEATCGNDPNIPGVELDEQGCDLLAISTQDERFDVPTSSDECYKIFRTYRVLNWCQFEEDLDIPGGEGEIGENDDVDDVYFDFTFFDRYTEIPPFIVSRDEDDDGNPGDENVTVRFITKDGQPNGGYGTIYVDRNCDPTDGNPSVNGGYWRKADTPQGTNSGTTLVAGFYQYTQVIKVYDQDAPVQVVSGETEFPSYTSVNPGEEDKLCTGIVTVMIEVTEECTPDGIRIVNEVVLNPDPALGLGPIVIYDDGIPTTAGTDLFGFTISGPEVTGDFTRKFTLSGEFPIGSHELEVTVMDGCGNDDADFVHFTVFDAKAPVPICISGISTNLMPVDDNNDGTVDGGMIAVWASDFIASDFADCSGIEYISIHRAIDIDNGAEPDPKQSSLNITCDDGEVVIVYIYAWDGAGNSDRCEAMLLVTDEMGLCDPQAGAVLAGNIVSEDNIPASDVQVNLSGQMTQNLVTSDQGTYSFNGLSLGDDYTISPEKNIDFRNGVSTLDLVVISKHILGVEALDSPYKMIAADVNASKSITTLDLITLRKLILNIETQFSNNTSWRFVDAKYTFPNPANPWAEPFPEVVNLNNIESSNIEVDFIILKVGDVNGSARINRTLADDRNIAGTFTIDVEDQSFVTGNEYSVAFTAADLAKVDGYQFTLNLSADVALVDVEYGVAKAENFGFIEDKVITTSWNGAATDEVLFTLVLRANADVALSEAMNISSRYTAAEAYNKGGALLDVAINFGGAVSSSADFALYQNTPNPFQGETVIGFNLPEAGKGTLSIYNIDGKLIREVNDIFKQGFNSVTFRAEDFPTDILYYTLSVGEYTATKKMIVLK